MLHYKLLLPTEYVQRPPDVPESRPCPFKEGRELDMLSERSEKLHPFHGKKHLHRFPRETLINFLDLIL